MQKGKASRTALRVAIRRAAHQLTDLPPVHDDPVAVRLIGDEYARDMERARHRVARDFRAYLAARSRYAEEQLSEAVTAGVDQFVVLGAGLDTFAYRNPYAQVHVYEVDFPATQEWKRSLLAEKGIEPTGSLTYVPLDFERHTLAEGLAGTGFDWKRPAFFSWLGVVPYLTLDAFRHTLKMIADLPPGSGISFDYVFAPESLTPARREIFARLERRLLDCGEPMQLFFEPATLADELRQAGFVCYDQADAERLNDLYFRDREDGLRLSPVRIGMLVSAWVVEDLAH